ncbi:hypothetical protein CMU96_06940 [Elizabethkingia anophelis]|nr:hypothetical protein [Elizabethkingia anophelis]MCT3812719.1 hypothetical protein [Elizabethkingia anophelis]MCT3819944.1 hypothetical protein [Elizabethkingia anophelis]MCT3942329.1 hypothetical protein [Elizabethkingia anophelis]MCT4195059.1 hypothetical protein [Elizabethkingia anophelis]
MNLVQERLDVKNKSKSNFFNWRGQFTPDFVEYILENIGIKDNSIVADPFAGSGTVLIESLLKNFNTVGFELNPSAFLMSDFYKYSRLSFDERRKFIINIEKMILPLIQNHADILIFNNNEKNEYRELYKGLILIAESFKSISNENIKPFLINILFLSEKDKKMTIKESILQSLKKLSQFLMSLPYSNKNIEVFNSDCRNIGNYFNNKIDLILTSPPYINVFNYHQNYRAIVEIFDYKILNVANSEFGSNRKNRGNRLLTVIQYCLDMELCLHSFWKSLKDNGKLVLVVGRESKVRKTPFFNSAIICDIIEKMEIFKLDRKEERTFKNKFGQEIIEDILFFKKNKNDVYNQEIGYDIAKKHLLFSMQFAPEEAIADFKEAIDKLYTIKPSPIYNI